MDDQACQKRCTQPGVQGRVVCTNPCSFQHNNIRTSFFHSCIAHTCCSHNPQHLPGRSSGAPCPAPPASLPASMEAVLSNAIARCPFLHDVAAKEGDAFARAIALDPTRPVDLTGGPIRRPVLEDFEDYQNTFRLWHGSGGVVPLVKLSSACPQGDSPARPPALRAPAPVQPSPAAPILPCKATSTAARARGNPLAGAPLATMSMSFGAGLPDFGKLFKALQQHHQLSNRRSQPSQRPKPTNRGGGMDSHGPSLKPKPVGGSGAPQPASTAGQCPLRKMLGPLAPLVFNAKGNIACPEAIVKARAALAATKPVRELRPQSLPVKLLAVGTTAAGVNVPCGMVREHTDKFSFNWFVAVHASIPFIAMLRKAVIMPKYAIIFTIAAAIAGQAMGARLERQRLATANSQWVVSSAKYPAAGSSAPLSKPLPQAHADAFKMSSSSGQSISISKAPRPGSRKHASGVPADRTALLVTPQAEYSGLSSQGVGMLAGTSPNALVTVRC